jgi:hypothetical protein
MNLLHSRYLRLLLPVYGSLMVLSIASYAQETTKAKPAPTPRADCGMANQACAKGIKGARCHDENGKLGVCSTLNDNECQCVVPPRGQPAAKPKPSPAAIP